MYNLLETDWNNFMKFDKDVELNIIEMYHNGLSCNKISFLMKTSWSTIRSILYRYNIKLRMLSEQNKRYQCNDHYFDNIDTQDKAYWLGMLYADGYNNEKGSISLDIIDKEHLEKFKISINSNQPIRVKHLNRQNSNWNDCYRFYITSHNMSNILKKYGMVNRKSLILKFPKFLKEHLLRHFIRGYFDGDGCLSIHIKNDKYKNKITKRRYTTFSIVSTKEVCMTIKDIIYKNLNIHMSLFKDRNIYVISISNKNGIKSILDWLYKDANIYLERKYKKYLEFLELIKPKIRVPKLHKDIYIIKNLYMSGVSANKLSDIFNISDSTIVKQLKLIGIKTRTIKESVQAHYTKQ